MLQLRQHQGVAFGGQEAHELSKLGLIRANRVRTAVRFELKPAYVLIRGGLQIEGHVEAECMLPHSSLPRAILCTLPVPC